jgi:hypothetical protein
MERWKQRYYRLEQKFEIWQETIGDPATFLTLKNSRKQPANKRKYLKSYN